MFTVELAYGIWNKIKSDPELQKIALDRCINRLLCGKTSVTWFTPLEDIRGCKEIIIENSIKNSGFNPFETRVIPNNDKLTSTPKLVCGANGSEDGEYYLRFIYKSGVSSNFSPTEMVLIPKSKVVTVYVNEELGIVEYRGDPRKAHEVVAHLADLMSPLLSSKRMSFKQTDIIAPFAHEAEKIADALNGQLIDTLGKPEFLLDEISDEEINAIRNVLFALDSYFQDEDLDKFIDELRQARDMFADDLLRTPFTALMLAGLQKVGMGGAEKDLRWAPLYEYLKPYLQQQGAYIRFKISEDGLEQTYTVRIGLTLNSVFFVIPATEAAIKHVRNRVIINVKQPQNA